MVGKDSCLKQEDYIYGLEFNVNVVTLFVEVLADQARIGKFTPGGNNKHAIQTAQYFVNKFFNKNFELKDCVKQVGLLRQRHATFSTIMMRDDVGWAIETNHIDCLEETWDEIVRADPFACAYATYGDPHWDVLKCIFGDPIKPNATTMKNESDREVIMIDADVPEPIGKYAPLNEVIEISSDKSGSISTNFWNELGCVRNSSDEEGSFRSPSLKTEMSLSNPSVDSKGKEKRFGDNICMNLYGASYVSSSTYASPDAKK